MSIPISFSVEIVGKAVLKDEAMLEMLKVVEEKDNLFASSPIGATMQDGGKRKRSVLVTCLFIINKKKRNIKLRKIDKRKRKMLVSKYIITIVELKKVE